jgi:hypothetical protein
MANGDPVTAANKAAAIAAGTPHFAPLDGVYISENTTKGTWTLQVYTAAGGGGPLGTYRPTPTVAITDTAASLPGDAAGVTAGGVSIQSVSVSGSVVTLKAEIDGYKST